MYAEVLDDLLLTVELELIGQDSKVMHRKNRKIHFSDPFVYNVLSSYARVELDQAAVVEGTVASHLARKYESYYWRNGSEVDIIALVHSTKNYNEQYGFEVKWGFKEGTKPRHIKHYLSLNKKTIPAFLASLPFG